MLLLGLLVLIILISSAYADKKNKKNNTRVIHQNTPGLNKFDKRIEHY